MNKYDNPVEFSSKLILNKICVEYIDLHEVCQGGPQVGTLLVNGKIVLEKCGGPLLFTGGNIYVPTLVRRFLRVGFKLAIIDVSTLSVNVIGKIRDLIYLDRVEHDKIYFFTDLDKTQREVLVL